jgi:Holliday junction resolvase RusA-like endonuclease
MIASGARHFPVHVDRSLLLEVRFYWKVPQRSLPSIRNQAGMVIYDKKKPDVDNLAKFVLDALTGLLYRDDEQVVKLSAIKLIDTEEPFGGRTVIMCYVLN